MSEWEHCVRADALTALADVEAQPLTVGTQVAWTEVRYMGVTDGLSSVHRVGYIDSEETWTYCNEQVPEPCRRLTLEAFPPYTLHMCSLCAEAYARSLVRRGAA